MSYRYHGRARVDPRQPRSFAICDRCGFLYNHNDLNWQLEWQGVQLLNLHLLVCRTCLDIPQEQLRTVVLPPDPTPTYFARPESFFIDDTQEFESQGLVQIVAQDGTPIISQGGSNLGAQNSTVAQLVNQVPIQHPV